MTGPLIIAVPSKGRLQDNSDAFFSRAGLTIVRPGGRRNYRGAIDGIAGVEIAFLSASEISRELAAGTVHLGVTGLDQVRETIPDPESSVHVVAPLGFGHADLVVAVPDAWIDVTSMTDLYDVSSDFRHRHGRRLSIATKYVHLTRDFFAEHGIADYRIVESQGATEGAPASGAAELIVDITTTGSTLAANNLKVLSDGVILRSQACLMASLNTAWRGDHLNSLRDILDRVSAEELARTSRQVAAGIDLDDGQVAEARERFDCIDIKRSDGGAVLLCPQSRAYGCAAWLRDQGADTVTVTGHDYIFQARNPLYEALAAKVVNK